MTSTMYIFRSRFLTEDVVKWRQEMFSAMEKDPDFRRDGSARMGLREERAKTFRRCVKALALIGETMDPFERKSKLVALQMYDPSLEVKVALLKDMPITAIMGSGTQRHEGTVDALTAREITGCFALTEMAHGSDAKATRTTAIYDPKAEEFVIHTPDFEAAKAWWVGVGFGA